MFLKNFKLPYSALANNLNVAEELDIMILN